MKILVCVPNVINQAVLKLIKSKCETQSSWCSCSCCINNNNNNIENNETKETYTISGVAWIDANKNGQKDADEILQDSVVVSLVDMKIGNFALDTNGNRITTITDSEGKYTFNRGLRK